MSEQPGTHNLTRSVEGPRAFPDRHDVRSARPLFGPKGQGLTPQQVAEETPTACRKPARRPRWTGITKLTG